MALDKRYDRSVSSLSPTCLGGVGSTPLMRGPMDVATINIRRASSIFTACSWSLTASSSTGPQRRNRWRAVAPEDPLRERPGAEPVRDAPPSLNNSSRSLAPVPPSPLLNVWCAVAQRPIPHRGTIENPGIILALIKSRGRKNGGGV
mgnify:CR=1 FL=1